MPKKIQKPNLSLSNLLVSSQALTSKRLGNYLTMLRSMAIKHLPDKEDLINNVCKRCVILIFMVKRSPSAQKRISSMLVFPLKNKWTIFLDKLSSSKYLSTLTMYLFKTLLQELIGKEKDYRPFWTPAFKELSEKLLLPTETVFQGLQQSSSRPSSLRQVVNSPSCTILKTPLLKTSLQTISCQSSISTTVDRWEKEAIKNETRKKLFRTVPIQIYPTQTQRQHLENIFDVHRYVYNRTLEYIKERGHDPNFYDLRDMLATENTKQPYRINTYYDMVKTKLVTKLKQAGDIQQREIINSQIRELDDSLKSELKNLPYIKNPLIRDFELSVSNEIRSNAVKSVCDAHKTGFSNLAAGNIKYFNMKYKKRNESRKCAELASTDINICKGCVKLCPGRLKRDAFIKIGKRNASKYRDLQIKNNCDLVKRNNKYYVYVSIPLSRPALKKDPVSFCGVDPGVRTFATVYGSDGVSEYQHKRTLLQKLNNKMDFLKCRSERTKKRCYTKLEACKRHYVDALHWKTINSLVNAYDVIFYGDIKSHGIVRNNKNRTLNRNMNDLKFHIFKQRLLYKSCTRGKKCVLVHESLTTQGCSACGNLNKRVGDAEIYICCNSQCRKVFGRDTNAAKNILMKGLETEF